MLAQATGGSADTRGGFGHLPQHARIAVRTTFTMGDGLEEAAGLQVGVGVSIRFREYHAGGHTVGLQMLHSAAGVLCAGPGRQVPVEFFLMPQAAGQGSELWLTGPGWLSQRET